MAALTMITGTATAGAAPTGRVAAAGTRPPSQPTGFLQHLAPLRQFPRLASTPPDTSHSGTDATFTVDTSVDSPIAAAGDTTCTDAQSPARCSLRAAIGAAENAGRADAIVVPKGTTIALSLGVLDVTASMDIEGPGATVEGGGAGIFEVSSEPSVEIIGLTLKGGSATDGGAVDCQSGSLVLSGVSFTGNTAQQDGGGLYSGGACEVWVEHSDFAANTANIGGGAAILGSGYVDGSLFGGTTPAAGNRAQGGGGLLVQGNVVVDDSTVSENSPGTTSNPAARNPSGGSRLPHATQEACGYGAGIANEDGVIDVIGTDIVHNFAPGGADGVGFANGGEGRVVDSVISFNSDTNSVNSYCDFGNGVDDGGYGLTMVDDLMQGNSSQPTITNTSIYGVDIASTSQSLDLIGTKMLDTTAGSTSGADAVYGGDVLTEGREATLQDDQISGTTVNARGSEVEGGALLSYDGTAATGITISGTTVSAEYVDGGALYTGGGLELTDSSISGTTVRAAVPSGDCMYGGVVLSEGTLRLDHVAISGSSVGATLATGQPPAGTACVYGGVIDTFSGTSATAVSVTGSTIDMGGGDGQVFGGVWDNNGPLVLTGSELVGATVVAADLVQGGVFSTEGGLDAQAVTLGDASVRVTGGTEATNAPVAARGSIFYNDVNNQGEGIDATLVNATLAGVTSTVAPTGASDYAVYNGGNSSTQFQSATIAEDTLSGPARATALVYSGGGVLSLRDSIVASASPASNCLTAPGAEIESAGYDLDNGDSCGFASSRNFVDTDPLLLPLADNGGPVETAALEPPSDTLRRAGSRAIGAGSDCPGTDARGIVRPQAGRCDIGAYELVAQGYFEVAGDGGVFHYGAGKFYGAAAGYHPNGPMVAVASTPDHLGYWMATSQGSVYAFGDAHFKGPLAGWHLTGPIVGMASGPDGAGYFLVNAEGQVYAFGDATYHGGEDWAAEHQTVVGIASTPGGLGYWLVTASGEVLAFGDATARGDAAGLDLGPSIVGMAVNPDGPGYWLASKDGGVFSYGGAKFYGSAAGEESSPVVGIVSTPDGLGYWLFGADGQVAAFGDAAPLGSISPSHLTMPVIGGTSANIGL